MSDRTSRAGAARVRAAGVALAMVLVLGATAGCDDTEAPSSSRETPSADSTPVEPLKAEPLEVGVDVTLLPGDDGTLPVKVRWSKQLEVVEVVEAVAVADGRVYATHDTLEAFDLETGGTVWAVDPPDIYGWFSDGGDTLGHDEDGNVWGWAPWNREWLADVETGELLKYHDYEVPGSWGPRGKGMKEIPLVAPAGLLPREEWIDGDDEFRVRDGRRVFSIRYGPEGRNQDVVGPWVAGNGIVLVTASGLLLVLDPVGDAWSVHG